MDIHFLRKLTRRLAKVVLILCIGLFVLSIAAKASGIYINTTPSLPLGFYKIIDTPIQKGAYVAFCPPQTDLFNEALVRGYIGSGNCPGGYSLLLKRVLAMAGDTVLIDQAGIVVNGKHLSNSAQLKADANNQPLPQYRFEAVLDSVVTK